MDVHWPLARRAFLFEFNAPLDMAGWYALVGFAKRVFVSGIFAVLCATFALFLPIKIISTF
ncbi:hypothetical protein ASD21_04010 [Caulobacter sp. Root1455]|nr:hypothetical protein ASD38_15155 [Caulobacter sp. Root487D2Y]KQY99130.1 hypothetical protein ASD21_04010 [Caulobacter sp. Root1455]